MPLTLNQIKKKPAAFFQDRRAKLLNDHSNLAGEQIADGEMVTIVKKSAAGLMLDIKADSGVCINNVWFEYLELDMTSAISKLEDLRKVKKVWMYIPALKGFYKMQVTEIFGEKPGFSVSNICMSKSYRVQGHEFLAYMHNQNDLDNFFYLEAGEVTCESYKNGEKKFELNGREWIFKGDSFLKKGIDLT